MRCREVAYMGVYTWALWHAYGAIHAYHSAELDESSLITVMSEQVSYPYMESMRSDVEVLTSSLYGDIDNDPVIWICRV